MNSGVEQKQGRLVLFGHSYLQHIPFEGSPVFVLNLSQSSSLHSR
jgi:hypothetical protein